MVIPGGDNQPRCPFCEEPGSSPEHIFGDWLGREVVKPVKSEHYRYAGKNGQVVERTANGLAMNGEVKAACYRCNNGWMSGIERLAKPLLLSMMQGNSHALDPLQQKTLAMWLCLKAMCYERVPEIERKAIPEDDYAFLYLNREPPLWRLPRDWYIWAATSNADFGKVGAFQASVIFTGSIQVGEADLPLSAYCFALVSGSFVGVAFRSPLPGDGPLFSEEGSDWFRPLWPLARTSSWPPPVVLPYSEIYALPENFIDAMTEAWFAG